MPGLSVMPDLIGHLLRCRGRELGLSGHEDAGAPDAVPPLAPTMSLTPSADTSPFAARRKSLRFILTPVVAIRAFARTGRPGYSLHPASSIVHPTPLPSPSRPQLPTPWTRSSTFLDEVPTTFGRGPKITLGPGPALMPWRGLEGTSRGPGPAPIIGPRPKTP